MTGVPMTVRCDTCGATWNVNADATCTCDEGSDWVWDLESLLVGLIERGVLVGVDIQGYDYDATDRSTGKPTPNDIDWLMRPGDAYLTPFVDAALWPKAPS